MDYLFILINLPLPAYTDGKTEFQPMKTVSALFLILVRITITLASCEFVDS